MSGVVRAVRDGRLVASAFLILLMFKPLVALVGYRRLTWMFPSNGSPPPEAVTRRVTRAVMIASRRLGGASCLTQACAVRALLGVKGYVVTMRIGIRDAGDGTIAAHAWLLVGDQVVLGAEVDEFQQFRPIADYR